MKFIELTSADGNKHLVNISLVTEVYDAKDKGSRLFFNLGSAENQACINVAEKYEDVKAILLAV